MIAKSVKTVNGVRWRPLNASVKREMKAATTLEVYMIEIAHEKRILLRRIIFISSLKIKGKKEEF